MRPRTTTLFCYFLLLMGMSCQEEKDVLEGDLYFSYLRFGSFYHQPDTIVRRFQAFADTAQMDRDSSFLAQYQTLKRENLLYSPFVDLELKDNSIITLYLQPSDYDKIKIYKRKDLQTSHTKIHIKTRVKSLENKLFLCKDLISVDRISGETYPANGKWKIEDYN